MKKILKSIRGSGSGNENKEKKDKTKGGNSKLLTHNKDGPNPLCAAAFSGDIDKASECIKHIGINTLDEKLGKAPLHFAARGGHLQMIKFLIDEGADPNLLCSDGRTPLFSAIEGAHETCANWLILKGHCTDKQDSTGSTVLHFSAYYGLPQNFRKIYTIHPHLISVYDKAGMMPIHVAVQAARDEIVNYICTVHPESCEAKTKVHEQTALMLAVQQESLNTILLLLEAGCRTDAVDIYGTSVELLAKGRANEEISSLLNQWGPQNNIEMTSEKRENIFEMNQNHSIPLASVTVLRQSPVPQFNTKMFGTDAVDSKQSEPGKFNNITTHKETTPTAVSAEHTVQSDNDSEWGSNSEAEGGQSKNEGTFNADLKKRISQAFLLPIQDDKAENIFKSTKKTADNVSLLLTTEVQKTDGTLGRERTTTDMAETLVRKSSGLKQTDDEKSTNASDEEESVPQAREENIPKTFPVLENKISVFSALKDRETIPEDQKISPNNTRTKDKLTEMSRDKVNLNQESDISEWSNSNEDKNENTDKDQNKDSSILDVDVDILSLVNQLNHPPKLNVLKPVEENTDSENDSSWDSDVASPISNTNMKVHSSVTRPGKAVKESSIEPDVKVSSVISSINENFKSLQPDADIIGNQHFLVQINDDNEDGLNPEVIKGWIGVMSELTEKVSSSKMLTTTTTDNDMKNSGNTISSSMPSTKSEDQLYSIESLNIENKYIPPATLSSQTCQITSSEIFGDIEASPKDEIDKELQDIVENEEIATIFTREKSHSVDSGPRLLNFLGTKPNSTNNLDSPLETEILTTAVPTLVTIPKLLDKAKAKKNKKTAKSEKSFAASHSIPLSSLLNDDVETLRKKISKRSYFNPLRFTHGKSDTIRKLSCPESNVPPSFLSKMKNQFSIKKPSLGKSGSLPDVNSARLQDIQIEESDQIVCELLKKAKEILLSTAANRTNEIALRRKLSHGDYQRDAENESSNEGDGCCDEQYPGLQGTYRSFQQPVLPLPSTRYCDSVSPNDPDPFVIKEVIKDLSCVIDKTYGNNVSLRGRSSELECEIERLRKELKCCECCKKELQNELLKLQADFSQAQYALSELAEGKGSLEVIITQLRAQVLRQEESLNCGSREKSGLFASVEELEMKMKVYSEEISQLEAERNDLIMSYKNLEELQNKTAMDANFKIADLEEALIRCSQQNQAFQEEINNMRAEINEIRTQAENLQFEKRRMLNEFEHARQSALNEKASMGCTISDLQRRLGLCEEQKKDICQKMNEIVSAHHVEMDKLSEEAAKYKGISECMNEELETLRQQLRDCEERKRNNGHQHNHILCESDAMFVNMTNNGNGRVNNYAEAQNQQQCAEFGNGEEKFRAVMLELELEREQMVKLRQEFDQEKEQWCMFKDQTEQGSKASDAVIQKLQCQLEEQALQLEEQISTLKNDRDQLKNEIHPLEQSNDALKQEVKKLTEEIQHYDAEKNSLLDMVKSKDRLEDELQNLKIAIDDQENQNQQNSTEIEKREELVAKLKHELNQEKEKWSIFKEQTDKDSKITDAEIRKLQTQLEEQKSQFEDQISIMKIDRERLQNEIFPLGQSNDVLKEEVKRLSEEIQIYDAEKNSLLDMVKSKDRLEVELQNLKMTIDEQEARNQQESVEVEKREDEVVAKLKHELDQAKNQRSVLKEQMDNHSKTSDAEIRKLQTQLEEQKLHLEDQISTLKNEREHLLNEILRQGQSNSQLNREIKKLTEEIQLYDAEKNTVLNMVKSKDSLEVELKNLKTAIDDKNKNTNARDQQDSAEVEKWEDKLRALKLELKSERELVANLRHKFEQAEFEKWEDKFRALRSELKSERELSTNLRHKFDQAKEQWTIFREQMDKDTKTSGPEIRKLQDQLEKQKSQFEDQISKLKNEREHLLNEIFPLEQSNDLLKREVKKLTEDIKLYDSEKNALLNMVKSKDRLEVELKNLKRAIDDQNSEARNQQESAEAEADKWKEKFRALRSELKSERELVAKLRHKFDQAKEQWSIFKEQMDKDNKASAPKIRNLQNQLEEQKSQFEDQISKLKNDREHLLSEILRQGQSIDALKRELKKLTEEIQLYDAEKNTLLNMVKSKDRLEVELKNLKRAIDDQYVDKTELERLKSAYDMQIATVKSQYEQQVQLGIDRKYSEITQMMDKQARDRTMIDQIRESNENILRTELSTTKKSSQMEILNLKRQIREKEEQIKSEISSRRLITEKFSVERRRNEDLLRKLSLLSTARSETLLAFNNNANSEDV